MAEPAIQTILNVSEAKAGLMWNRGKYYALEGECDTDRCGAVCCKTASLQGRVGEGPCRFLQGDLRCELHAISRHVKPISCLVWPTSQASIDVMNEQAERLGLEGRCHLKMVEVADGDST